MIYQTEKRFVQIAIEEPIDPNSNFAVPKHIFPSHEVP